MATPRVTGAARTALAVALLLGTGCARTATVAAPRPAPSPVVPVVSSPSRTPAPVVSSAPRTPTPSHSSPSPASPSSPAPPVPPARSSQALRSGDAGPAVRALQQRLLALGYWLDAADGTYDAETRHAVVALQKAAGLARDGVAGPLTMAALAAAVRPVARSRSGAVVEIDLARQLVLFVRDGAVTRVLDTSTGRHAGATPRGRWQVTYGIDGFRRSELGLLYRPRYFHGGVAVHGFTSVPPYPASHGCVRVTYRAMDAVWADRLMPAGEQVWVY